jgi:hypothetical protein
VTEEPKEVHIIGSFSHWQKIEMQRDGKLDAWHVTLHHIPGNRTHHYMLLVDGKPTFDKTCDGLAVPHGFQEEQWQLQTDRGPRVLMLFAHAPEAGPGGEASPRRSSRAAIHAGSGAWRVPEHRGGVVCTEPGLVRISVGLGPGRAPGAGVFRG